MLKNNYNKKYLFLFLKLGSYLGHSNKIKHVYSYNYLCFYRYNYGILNLSKKLLNLKFFLSFYKRLIFLNCRFLFITTNLDYSKLIFFYTKKLNQYCFAGDWISGSMTNINERFNNIFIHNKLDKFQKQNENNNFYFSKKTKINFIRFFKNKNYKKLNKKIDIVFFIGSDQNKKDFSVIKECSTLKIPIMGFFNSNFNIEYSPFFLLTNVKNFFNIYFLFLLIIRYYIFLQNKFYGKGKKNLQVSLQKKLKYNLFRVKKLKKLKKF